MSISPTSAAETIVMLGEKAWGSVERLLDVSRIEYDDINAGSDFVFVGWNPHRWTELTGPDQLVLDSALDDLTQWRDEARRVLSVCAARRVEAVDAAFEALVASVGRRDGLWPGGARASSVPTVRELLRERVQELARTVDELLPAASECIVVPDTNALLHRPRLHEWTSPSRTTLVLTPSVLTELDEIKMRQNAVAEKAASLIRQLEGLEQRGDTFEGVPLAGPLRLRELGLQPNVEAAPEWLDRDHRDDQLLLAALHLRAAQPRSSVQLLTLDRNLRNKARPAHVATATFGQEITLTTPSG